MTKKTKYKVYYYVQNIDNTEYTLKETNTLSGRTNADLALFDIAKTIKGTTYEKATLGEKGEEIEGTYRVSSDGSTEIFHFSSQVHYQEPYYENRICL